MENFEGKAQEKIKQLEDAGVDLRMDIEEVNSLDGVLHQFTDEDIVSQGYDPEDVRSNAQDYEKKLEDLRLVVEEKARHFYDLMRQVVSPEVLANYEAGVESGGESLAERMERIVAGGRKTWEAFLEDPTAFIERFGQKF